MTVTKTMKTKKAQPKTKIETFDEDDNEQKDGNTDNEI